ncbi:uncharacterized protein EDB91DRAFT_822471 [Suillus paluster]|uniref:uncharacterized protein n=1 Tax=Suillus paluster TaxID=48578 RepID=UPI001B8812F7|nr:uncharacterized protein EDB91DRAFT_822471 [Suillus paluster]KAG1748919.1 hypothetical protein EDB91DRAFT_822471 [Suillus paluster]
MTLVSDDSNLWPLIDFNRVYSYFSVAAFIVVVYDWALALGQEFDLVWRQRWSLMTILYLSVRYVGILYSAIAILRMPPYIRTFIYSDRRHAATLPSVSVTNTVGTILCIAQWWMSAVVNAMIGVIIITRLHAMYQRSRKMLIFLVVIFLAKTITCGVISAMNSSRISGEELVLSGIHMCNYNEDNEFLSAENLLVVAAWEVLTLCLAVWIAVKHFRELQRPWTGSTIGDCFTVLIKTHIFYFAAFTVVSCFIFGLLSHGILKPTSVGAEMYLGVLRIFSFVQLFVLGPRLIIGVREYHATFMANFDAGTGMATIAF